MISPIPKKVWTDQEKAHLSFGYHLGASLKTLSIVLKRTETALNKAMSRLGIRQYGAFSRGKKSPLHKFKVITPEQLRQAIETNFSNQPPESSGFILKKYDNESSNFSLKVNFKDSVPNTSKLNKRFKRPVPLPQWVDLDFAIELLKKRGHQIRRYQPQGYQSCGLEFCYEMNGIPMSAAQLLIQANSLRLEEGLEPFYVNSITEH